MLVGMASEISKKYTYKCVDHSRHNGIKDATNQILAYTFMVLWSIYLIVTEQKKWCILAKAKFNIVMDQQAKEAERQETLLKLS